MNFSERSLRTAVAELERENDELKTELERWKQRSIALESLLADIQADLSGVDTYLVIHGHDPISFRIEEKMSALN